MNESLSTPSLRNIFKYPFESKDWIVPFIIGTALIFAGMIIPIIPLIFVYGYLALVMRMSINGEVMSLPAWSNWGRLFKDGLRSLAVGAVYLGPGIIVSMIGFSAYIVMFVASIALTDSSFDSTTTGLVSFLMISAMGILFLSMFVGTLLLIAGAIPLPAAIGHFIANDKLAAAFYIREWGRIIIKDRWGYLIAWLIVVGMFGTLYIGFMLAYMTFVLCFVGYILAFPIGFYIMLVSAALFGQNYREGKVQLESESPGI
jgi:Protein of unknown function (DUF4013)